MRTDEIELSAARNRPLPKNMSAPEMYLYLSMRALYSNWRRGDITKESAASEKKVIMGEFRRLDDERSHWCEVHKAYQENIRKADVLMSEIEKSEDTAVIAVKACEIVGLLTGEENFAIRQKRKIKDA